MEGRTRHCGGFIIGLVILVIIIAVAVIYSGLYNVAANYPDKASVAWVFSTTMDHSVRRHASGIKSPALDDPAMVQAGFNLYRGMCRGCHGAPGAHIETIVKGFNPEPPELTESAGDWKPNELFWITKYGVRMSGMPAWGITLPDKQIWSIVAFMRKLPSMTPAEYQALDRKAPKMMRR
jgi:mono/diheme cytochrome c family protein